MSNQNQDNKFQPILFVGHGSPMNALAKNNYAKSLNELGQTLLKNPPDYIISFSAHWVTDGLYFTAQQPLKQIYDMYGFPEPLYQLKYIPQPIQNFNHSELYQQLIDLKIQPTTEWGLDHGSWSVLTHLFPQAHIPTLQISLPHRFIFLDYYQLGKNLAPLLNKNILFLGSGNIVHNLRNFSWQENAPIMHWSHSFDQWVNEHITQFKDNELLTNIYNHEFGKMSVPTPEHFAPLAVMLGLRSSIENVKTTIFIDEIQNGSLSMRSYKWNK